ncbi:class D sortase [Paenibacillus vini]|uniref:class D sortase n=1 Tax=Paenibacillus vini TaxID=1476024 RepID=UPI0025B6662C|nr:class D sortase [Paenibacillus vini]MDN4070277.1 class D sortase [Paenibacillus vini]
MKKLGNLLLAFGLAILVYVGVGQVYYKHQTEQRIESYLSLPFDELNQSASAFEKSSAQSAPEQAELEQEGTEEVQLAVGTTLAVLNIPKIKLTVPVLEGAGLEQLKEGAGHLPETAEIGTPGGNSGIAAHRSWTFGQYFNRLDEMEVDDEFQILTKNRLYTYRILGKTVVEPTDISVLEPVSGKTMLTLITCHPLHSNKQRLIVAAEQIKDELFDPDESAKRVGLAKSK